MFHTPAGDGYACQLRLESDSNAAMIAGSLRQFGETFTAPLYNGTRLVFCILSNNLEGAKIIAVLARFPGFIEHIPCFFITNKGGTICHLADPIICHIWVSVCIINKSRKLSNSVNKGAIFDEWLELVFHVCFVVETSIRGVGAFWGASCDTLQTGFRRNALPLRSVENLQRNGAAVGTPNGGRFYPRNLRS